MPVATTVTTPVAGTVTIQSTTPDAAPSGYTFVGQQVNVTAPDATSANPLVLAFQIDQSVLSAAGVDASTLTVFRNGAPSRIATRAPPMRLPIPVSRRGRRSVQVTRW
jgi:predicted secreted protein